MGLEVRGLPRMHSQHRFHCDLREDTRIAKMVQDTNPTQTGGHTTLHDARPTDARHYTTQDRRTHDTTRHKTDAYTTLNDTKPTDTDTK